MLGVNSDANRESLKQTLVEEQISWRSWWDKAIDGPIHTEWQIELRPAIHILDHQGVIRYKNIAPEEVDAAIEKLLSEVPRGE